MAAGGSLEVAYPLPAPVPAGTYHIGTMGTQAKMDAVLHADLLYRHAGFPDVVVASADGALAIDADVEGPAVPAQSGDLLVLHLSMTSGTGPYSELQTTITIP
jgi:hypothetical protein